MTEQTLETLRQEIDLIDKTILEALAARINVMQEIVAWKNAHHIPQTDLTRWRQVLSTKIEEAEKLGLDTAMIRDIYNRIHETGLQLAAHH